MEGVIRKPWVDQHAAVRGMLVVDRRTCLGTSSVVVGDSFMLVLPGQGDRLTICGLEIMLLKLPGQVHA